MLPTIPRWDSRSMKSSETRPSSRRATLVSWGVVLTIRSLVMEGPFHEPAWGRAGAAGARLSGGGLEVGSGARAHGQLAKRRIRTFSMRPRARNEERTDEPP